MMSARLKQNTQTARRLVHDVSTTKTKHRLPEAWSMMSARLKQNTQTARGLVHGVSTTKTKHTDCQRLGPWCQHG